MRHNHGPDEGDGIYCREVEIDGKVVGICLIMAALAIGESE